MASDQQSSPDFSISVSKIALTLFEVNEDADVGHDGRIDYNANYFVQIFFNSRESFVKFVLRIEFKSKIEPYPIFIKAAVTTTYSIEGLDRYIEPEDGVEHMALPDPLMMSLLSMSASHARARLSVHTAQTRFSNCYMPIVDSKILLEQLMDPKRKS